MCCNPGDVLPMMRILVLLMLLLLLLLLLLFMLLLLLFKHVQASINVYNNECVVAYLDIQVLPLWIAL